MSRLILTFSVDMKLIKMFMLFCGKTFTYGSYEGKEGGELSDLAD